MRYWKKEIDSILFHIFLFYILLTSHIFVCLLLIMSSDKPQVIFLLGGPGSGKRLENRRVII